MALHYLLPDIEKIVLPFLEREGVELVELAIEGKGKTSLLRMVVWKRGGIAIGEISRLARHISDLLDEEDIIPDSFTMEVSSPGLDRELKTEADFRRAEGEKVEIGLKDGSGLTGEVISSKDGKLVLQIDDESKQVPIESITKGNIVIDF